MLRAQDGFTLIEVLVAATILVIGLGGTLGLVMSANSSTTAAAGTEGGTNLAREVLERVRELPPNQVTPAAVAGALQGMSGLNNTDTSGSGAWTVTRRNTTYALNVDVCAVDDPKDGSGPHTGATFCTDGGAVGSSDSQPQDYLRVTADVSWKDKSGQTRHVKQVTMLSGRGADGPGITAIVATAPTFPQPAAPILSNPATNTISFKISADTRAAHVYILLDGAPVGQASPVGNGVDWTYNLDVTPANRPDKSYEFAAYADDSRGVNGTTFFIPLLINRYAPAAPGNVVGSVNTVFINGVSTPVVEVSWDANDEANVIGYQVYRPDGSIACDLRYTDDDDDHTHCMDPTPQDGNYQVAAVYQDANNNINYSARANASTPMVVFPPRTWYLDNHTRNTGSGTPCVTANPGPDKVYDLAEVPTNGLFVAGGNKIQNAGAGSDNHRFCSPPTTGPIKAGASNAVLNLYLKNGGAVTCPLTLSATFGGLTLPAKQLNVTSASSLSLYTVTWPLTAQTIATGSRLVLDVDWDPAKNCDKGEEDFNSTTNPSALTIPTVDYPAPKPPTNVTSTTTSDGLQLTWSAPTTGIAPAFYRIYRDGYNYDQRYDYTDDAATTCPTPTTCTYTDPRPDPGGNTYYVTTVSSTLQESDPAPLPPAVFP